MDRPKSIRPQGPKRHVRHEDRKTGQSAKATRFRILRRDGFTCQAASCRKTLPENELEVDHVLPLAAGGTDDDANKQTLCKSCHIAKSGLEQSTRFGRRSKR